MKIGIVCYPSLGGSGVVATELGHGLAIRGHEVHFITYEVPFRLRLEDRNIYFHQVEINQYDLFKYPDYALTLAVKIAQVSQKFALDILHVHYAIPHAVSAFLSKQLIAAKKPYVITTLHGTDITIVGKDPAYFDIVRFSIVKSDGVTAVSSNLRKQTMDYFDIHQPIEVIYNFFTPKTGLIGNKPLRSLFAKPGEKLLLHSSNFRPVKRPLDVVRIFEKVRKEVNCKLLFMGTGVCLEEVRTLVRVLGLEDAVYFVGENRDFDPYVASADLFLLPSAQESFGLAALEAMAYGLPVVCSNTGGLSEVVEHGKTGFLAPVGDLSAMTDFCLKILTDENVYERMSSEAIHRAAAKFSMENILPLYEKYYEKIATAHKVDSKNQPGRFGLDQGGTPR